MAQSVRQPAKTPAPAPKAPARKPVAIASPSTGAVLQARLGTTALQQLVMPRVGVPARRGSGSSPASAPAPAAPKAKPAAQRKPEPAKGKAAATEKGADKGQAAAAVEEKAGAADAAVALHMPEPPTRPSPASAKRIAGVKTRAGGTAAAQASLPPGAEQVEDAQQAVTPPDAERLAAARAELIAQVKAAPNPAIVKLCERIRQVIRDKRPPDEDALLEAKPEEAAQEAGGELNSTVSGETRKVEANYGAMNDNPAAAPAVPGAPLPPQPAAAETAPVNARAGVPDAVPAANVSLDKDAEESRRKADEAGMNKPAAALVQSGPIGEARSAQGELDQAAKEDPALVLARQQEALAKADAGMGALQVQALAALTAARAGTAGKAAEGQRGMVGTEAEMRAKAGGEAKAIFDQAQTAVKGLLKDVTPNAMTKWEEAKNALTRTFKEDLKTVQDRVDERHSGASGFVVGLWDAVTGLPDWATKAYDKAEKNFADGVIAKLLEISQEVESIIAACQTIIDSARTRIAKIFSDLPASLQSWAAQEQAWFDKKLDGLKQETVAARDAFTKDISQQASQAVDEVRTEISELRKKAGGLLGRIADAIRRFVDDPAKFIIEGLLELLGISPPAFWAVVAKIKKVVDDIVEDPLGFANNLMAGIGQGFSLFFGNFAGHMVRGFLTWLLGDLKDVQVPKDVSLRSIVTFFLQIMGITWPNIRKIIAKKIGEKNVALIEKVYSLVSLLMEKGPEGIFDMIKEKLDPQAIVDQVVQMAVEFMVTAIAKQVAARLLLLFNPAGAILQAIEAIYRVLKWVFQNAAKIFTLVETIVNGLADIVSGNVGGFAKAVERGLAMLIPPVLAFVADYFSLGDLPKMVAKQIKGFREWILAKIEAGFDWLIAKGKALLAALGIGGKKKGAGEGADVAVGEEIEFDADGEAHRLWIDVSGASATLMVASEQQTVAQYLGQVKRHGGPTLKPLAEQASALLADADRDADELAKLAVHAKKKGEAPGQAKLSAKQKSLTGAEKKIVALLARIFKAWRPIKPHIGKPVDDMDLARMPLGYDIRNDSGTFEYGGEYDNRQIQRAGGYGAADEAAFPKVHVDRGGLIKEGAGLYRADYKVIDLYERKVKPLLAKTDADGTPLLKGGPSGPPNSLKAGANRDRYFNMGIRKQMEAIIDAINRGLNLTGIEVKVGTRRIDYTLRKRIDGRMQNVLVEYKHWTGTLEPARAIELSNKLEAQLTGQILGGKGKYTVLIVEWPAFGKLDSDSRSMMNDAISRAADVGEEHGVTVMTIGVK